MTRKMPLILQTLECGFQDKLKAVGFISLAAQVEARVGRGFALDASGQQVEADS